MLRSTRSEDDVEVSISDEMPLKGGNTATTAANTRSNGADGGKMARIIGDLQDFSASGRQRRRQYLAGALIAAGFLFLLIVYLVVQNSGPASIEDADEGVSDVWDELPSNVREMIDRDVNPCDDFYQFSCGQWLKNADIPGDKSAIYASFSTVEDQNELVLKDIMRENLPYIHELYSTCMNTTALDAVRATPLEGMLKDIANVKDRDALFRLAGTLSKDGPELFTRLGVQADSKDATVYALYASQSGLSLPDPTYYTDSTKWDDLASHYQAFVATLLQLADPTLEDTVAESTAKTIVDFEQALAKLYIPKEQLVDPTKTYNPVAITDLQTKYPLLFKQYLTGTGILGAIGSNTVARAPQKDRIIVETPDFFDKAEDLVGKTPLSTLQVVLRYKVLAFYAPRLSEDFIAVSFEFFSKRVGGQKERTPRWKLCQRRVNAHFPNLMGKYYVIKKFDLESEMVAKDLVDRLERVMRSTLEDGADWLDSTTRDAAVKKMDLIRNLIGHSSRPESFPFVLNATSYWRNLEILSAYEYNRSVLRIGTTVDREEWFMTASDVNAYYDPSTNQIVFPAGILQPPFFDRKRHPAQNFGAIGAIIGHEMTHGFDNSGRYYDGQGNMVDWWHDDTDAAFKQRAQCLVEQYSKFPVVSAIDETTVLGNVNGEYTLGENIADHGGVKVAFKAMEAYLFDRTEAEELRDPQSMSRNAAEKLFFLSFAQAFCAKSTDEGMIQRLSTDPHAPERWRVNGVMMHNPEFARVFECPSESAMVPAKQCQVW